MAPRHLPKCQAASALWFNCVHGATVAPAASPGMVTLRLMALGGILGADPDQTVAFILSGAVASHRDLWSFTSDGSHLAPAPDPGVGGDKAEQTRAAMWCCSRARATQQNRELCRAGTSSCAAWLRGHLRPAAHGVPVARTAISSDKLLFTWICSPALLLSFL